MIRKAVVILVLFNFFIYLIPSKIFSQDQNQEQFDLDKFLQGLPDSGGEGQPSMPYQDVGEKTPQWQGTQETSSQEITESTMNDTGKISLDIKGMDILDVLKMLAKHANLNIVVGKDVRGKVSMFIKDVPPMDALEMILASNGLAYVKEGGMINVITDREYETRFGIPYSEERILKVIKLKYIKAVNLNQSLNQIKTKIGRVVVDEGTNTVVLFDVPAITKQMEDLIKTVDTPLRTKIFGLNYAGAKQIDSLIQEVLTKGVGMMKYDERTNKIVVTDYPDKLKKIERIIKAFDEKNLQVLIDSQIIEIKPTEKFQAGIDWDYWLEKNLRVASSLKLNTGTSDKVTVGTTSVTGYGDYKGILDILSTIGETKVLSSPRIMAVNNQEAKILVGTRDAYVTSSVSQSGETAITSETVNYVDVGVKLYVTPTISRDGFVTMKIRPEVSSSERLSLKSGDKTYEVPIVSTSEAETSVVVKDGVTVIIAGLKKDEKYKTVKKIPLLGDIPFLGAAFRSKSQELKKTELVIFLTPHIASGDKPLAYDSLTSDKAIEEKALALNEIADSTMRESESLEVYKSFILKKIEEIAGNLSMSEDRKGKVEISFLLSKEGQLLEVPAIIYSTNKFLNEIAVQSVQNASPFPHFPKDVSLGEEQFKAVLSWD